MEIDTVPIIGAGPAGIAAAIQLHRYGIHPLLFEKDEVGGLLRNANLVENYPGFPGGITGSALLKRMTRQLKDAAVNVIHETVVNVDIDRETFVIETPSQKFHSLYAVVASGTKPRKATSLEISTGVYHHVYYEVAQLSRNKGKKIVIVGAGDAAFDYAINLSRANEVVILNRGTAVKCIPLLWVRALAIPTIAYYPGVVITRILEAGGEQPMYPVCICAENGMKFWADEVVFAIGREPQLDFLSENARLCQNKIITDGKFYFIGDVKNKLYRQTAIAVGDGVLAAMMIFRSMDR
jgi:thioredoxin reductase (NADPH)